MSYPFSKIIKVIQQTMNVVEYTKDTLEQIKVYINEEILEHASF